MTLTGKVRFFSFAITVLTFSFIDGLNSYLDKTTLMTFMTCCDLYMTLTSGLFVLNKCRKSTDALAMLWLLLGISRWVLDVGQPSV